MTKVSVTFRPAGASQRCVAGHGRERSRPTIRPFLHGTTMKFPTTILALSLLSAPALAQGPAWQDDFNDGVIDPMWTITFNPLTFWNCGEAGGTFNFAIGASPFGTFGEQFHLEAAVPAQSGALTARTAFNWSENPFSPTPGASVLDQKWDLLDAAGNVIARVYLNDTTATGTEMIFEAGGVTASVSGLAQDASADLVLARDAAGNWSYAMTGAAAASGPLGTDATAVEKTQLYMTVVSAGIGLPPVGEVSVDYVEIDAPAGPVLSITGSCPGIVTVDLSGMTPNGSVVLAYGVVGSTTLPGGPCAGLTVGLTNIVRVGVLQADAQGNISLSRNAPPAACGSLSAVAADVATCTVTNIVAL